MELSGVLELGGWRGGLEHQLETSAVPRSDDPGAWFVAVRLHRLVVLRREQPLGLGYPCTHRADRKHDVDIGVGPCDGLVKSAVADLGFVEQEALHLGSLEVIPFGLTVHDRPDYATAGVVLVHLGLSRLPAEESLLADLERPSESQTVSEGTVNDEALGDFGARIIPCSCMSTTSVTRSRRSA